MPRRRLASRFRIWLPPCETTRTTRLRESSDGSTARRPGHRRDGGALRRGAHPRGARAPRRRCTAPSTAGGASCSGPARTATPSSPRAARWTSSPRPRTSARTSWRVAPPAPGLEDRRVEITGPTDRKMTINALNSGAKVWLADFEDANTPAVGERGRAASSTCATRSTARIDFTSPEGKTLRARPTELATIVVRPRGWHLPEKHLARRRRADLRRRWSTSALYFFHCAPAPARRGHGPVLLPAQDGEPPRGAAVERRVRPRPGPRSGIPQGTIRATVLIETYPGRVRDGGDPLRAARALRRAERRAAGTTCSASSRSSAPAAREFLLPDRNSGDDDRAVHARLHRAAGAHLPQARRARDRRHGGVHPEPQGPGGQRGGAARRSATTRPARPATASTAPGWRTRTWCRSAGRSSTPSSATGPNQLDRQREDVHVTAERAARRARRPRATSPRPACATTSASASSTSTPGCGGNGAVGIFNLMEDAATAEISRSQVWQWLHNDVELDDGRRVTRELVERLIDEELAKLRGEPGATRPALGRRRGAVHARWRWPTSSPSSSPSRRTSGCREAMPTRHRRPSATTGCARGGCGASATTRHHRPRAAAHLRVRRAGALPGRRPALVVLPEDAEQVAAVVRACAEHGVPFVARGSGTGLSGGALPHADGVLIVTSRMRAHPRGRPRRPARRRRAGRDQPRRHQGGARRTATTTRPTRPASRSARSAATSRRTPAARTASSTASPPTTSSASSSSPPTASVVELGGDGAGRPRLRPARRVRRLRGHARHRHRGDRPADPAARGGAHAARRLRRHRRRPARRCRRSSRAGVVPAAIEMMDALAIEAAEAAVHCGYPEGAGAVLVVELDGPAAEVEHAVRRGRAAAAARTARSRSGSPPTTPSAR